MDLEKLRDLASKATPGPWKVKDLYFGGPEVWTDPERYQGVTERVNQEADAAYIAAASPDTVLSLLDRLAALEDVLRTVLPWVAPPQGGMTYRAYDKAVALLSESAPASEEPILGSEPGSF